MLTTAGCHRPADGGNPTFLDYGRFVQLLSTTSDSWQSSFQHAHSSRDNRTPSLVSFVGQTGHGKSTLVKLLVDLHISHTQVFSTPVVGAPGGTDPTSENVHLYSDPVTATSETPLLYADCEGLLGGEREPISAKLKRTLQKSDKVDPLPSPVSERELAWADNSSVRSRQFAVTHLYPRLLYTFSDVIVFVLKNPR
jgi:energy-coupling factor transporter ATP-binding protein EcfA2